MYIISKMLPSYKFEDVMDMPYVLKELLYQLILNDYGTTDGNDSDENFIDLDTATMDQIEQKLGVYKNE